MVKKNGVKQVLIMKKKKKKCLYHFFYKKTFIRTEIELEQSKESSTVTSNPRGSDFSLLEETHFSTPD